MLVAGQENVEVQFLANAVGDVLMCRGKRPAAGKIALKSSVIDAHGQIDLALQRRKRCGGRRDGILNPDSRKMLRTFPDVYIIGDDTDDADARPFSSICTRAGKRTSPSSQRTFSQTQRARSAFR